MIQSGGSLPYKTSIDNFVNFPLEVLESYSKALDNIDTEKKKNNNEKNLFTDTGLNIIGKKFFLKK